MTETVAPDRVALDDVVLDALDTARQQGYDDDLVATSARVADAVLATRSVVVPAAIAEERLQEIIGQVKAQRFTDDDGNDAGPMSSGHAIAGVLLTLGAVGIRVNR